MKVPVEITYRHLEKTEAIDALVREKIEKLEKMCNYISSCRVAVEKAHDHPQSGSPYRVRIDLTVPPSHELAVVQNPGEGNQYDPLEAVIRSAFDAARRQLVELVERQRDAVKTHPQQEVIAIVTKLFPEEGYGFLKTIATGQEIYFHRHSVSGDEFDHLKVGTGVQFMEEQGDKGAQATSVRIVNQSGSRAEPDQQEIEPPLGWR